MALSISVCMLTEEAQHPCPCEMEIKAGCPQSVGDQIETILHSKYPSNLAVSLRLDTDMALAQVLLAPISTFPVAFIHPSSNLSFLLFPFHITVTNVSRCATPWLQKH